MKWKILHIYEDDYGCEERLPDEELMCLAELESEDGSKKELRIADSFLRENALDEGSYIDLN